MHQGIILGLLDEVVEQFRLHGNGDDRVHGGGGGGGSLREIHSAQSASVSVSLSQTPTMNQKLRVGESLDNELTAMFTLNPLKYSRSLKVKVTISTWMSRISRSTFQDTKDALLCNNSDRF